MREREAFLDRLRLAATCAVVLLHTITGVMDNTDMNPYHVEKRVFLALLDLSCWCVPVFLMISGYLFLDPKRKFGMVRMVTKYCRRIVLALFLFGVPYACLEQAAVEGGFRVTMVGEAFLRVIRVESWSHMWYLYLILILYLATPPLKWLLGRVPRWTVYGLQLLLFAGCSLLPWLRVILGQERIFGLPGDGIYLFYYVCGYLFATREPGRPAAGRGMLPGLAVLLAAAMAAGRLLGYEARMAYNYPFTVLLSLLLFGWGAGADRGAEKKEGRGSALLERAAALSFAVYLIHPVFLNLAYKYFHVTPLSFPLWLSLPLFFPGTLLLSLGSAWLLYRIPPLRKYVL